MRRLNACLRTRIGCVAVFLCAIAFGPGAATVAWSQGNSDFVSQPRNMTNFKDYVEASRNVRQLTFNRMPGLLPEYKIGAGDELEITILGLLDEPRNLKVSGDGFITISLAGLLKVADLTAEEVETAIAQRLKEKELINDAQVLVYIAVYEAMTAYTLGEVDRPGEYAMSFPMTLMDLIFISGGVDFSAARYGYLHRRSPGARPDWNPTFVKADQSDLMRQPEVARPGSEVIEIDLQPMKDGKALERNILLRNGDVLYIPRKKLEIVYVIGDVNKAGAFELPQERRMTASRAIAWAGGPAKTAKMSKGILVRYELDGKRREFPVDFAAILRGESPDVEVRPNDVIFVPGSNGKTLAYGLLNTIPNVVATGILF